MTLNLRTREQMLAHCGAIRPDDGVDPRRCRRPPRNLRCRDRKTRQLCQQVGQTLDQLFAEGFGGPGLTGLRVDSVRAAPDPTRLLVRVVVDEPGEPFRLDLIASRLQRQAGRLRTEVARAITRRRAPTLTFAVVGRGAEAA